MNIVASWKKSTLAKKAIEASEQFESAGERPENGEAATQYELLQAQMYECQKQLKTFAKGTAEKNALKEKFLPEFTAHIDGAIAAMNETGKALQDHIFTQIMVWQFDLKNYEKALEMAELAIKHGLEMPPQFKSSVPVFIIDHVADDAMNAFATLKTYPLEVLQRVEELTQPVSLADGARAKLKKAIGQQFFTLAQSLEAGDTTIDIAGGVKGAQKQALDYFVAAQTLDKNIQVKKMIETLNKKVS